MVTYSESSSGLVVTRQTAILDRAVMLNNPNGKKGSLVTCMATMTILLLVCLLGIQAGAAGETGVLG